MKKLLSVLFCFAFAGGVYAANDFYTHGGFPATGSTGSSAGMRAELDAVMAGFDKLPALTGNANKAVVVNSGGTGLTVTPGTFSLSGNLTTTGAFNTTLAQGATITLTLPLVNGTVATLTGTDTFTTKTFNLSSNTLSGTTAQFNTALSDNDFATLSGSESLSNKTLSAPVLSGTATGTYTLGGTPTIVGHTVTGLIDISGASAGQISFPASQNASVGANVLDDYEEGTWTPSLGGNTIYGAQTGQYVKVGKVVNVWFQIDVTTLGTGSANTVSGLPISTANPAEGLCTFTGSNVSAVALLFSVNGGATSGLTTGATAAAVALTTQNFFKDGAHIHCSMTYIAQN